jgi:streptomycin 6-kinase
VKVPAELARSVRARWPDRAERWLAHVEPELDELCRFHSATPQNVLPARYALVVSAVTADGPRIFRATPDPEATAQATVAAALGKLGIAPTIHAAITTDTGALTVMDQVLPGTALAHVDSRALCIDDLVAPLRAMIGKPAPSDELPSMVDWLQRRLSDDHLADLPPGEATAQPTDRRLALSFLKELATDARPGLCHGDASPWNILNGPDRQWMLIDPRGMSGDVHYDAAVMVAKLANLYSDTDAGARVADATGLELDRMCAWTFVARAARV